MSLLAERTGMSPSAASHMIDNLMSAGMVERKQSATDRRAVLVTIANASQDASAAIESAQQQAIDDLLGTLEEEESSTYIRVLDKLYALVVERDGM
jgi:DNA-binding MarR family transcriptional regulator